MKKLFSILILSMILIGLCPTSYALSFSENTAYTNYALNRAKFCPNGAYARNRFMRQQRNNYIYTPQQARYNGYRTGIGGTGYNNTYYYNRYRR